MSLTAESLFDLCTLVEDIIPSSIINPHINDSISQVFDVINLFGAARNIDNSFNSRAVENLFRLFAQDITLIEHYIDQLSARFYFATPTTESTNSETNQNRFIRNLDIISRLVASVQRILRRIDINNARLYAPWRFALYRIMTQCISMIDVRIHNGRLPVYQQYLQACGGIDFSPELHLFCEILQLIGTRSRLYYAESVVGKERFNALEKMLQGKIQPPRLLEKKKSPLSQSWSSSSDSDEEEEEEETLQHTVESMPIDAEADPIDTLLSIGLANSQISDDFFKGLLFFYNDVDAKKLEYMYQKDKETTLNESNIVVAKATITIVEPIGSSPTAKWRSPSLEAAKERYRISQEEKKKKKRFPYRRQRKSAAAAAVDAVDKLVSKSDENVAENPVKKEEATLSPAKKTRKTQAVATPPSTPPSTPPPAPVVSAPLATPTTSSASPEKKKKKERYNKVWMRK